MKVIKRCECCGITNDYGMSQDHPSFLSKPSGYDTVYHANHLRFVKTQEGETLCEDCYATVRTSLAELEDIYGY